MTGNYAEIDVDGPAAKHIANTVIGSLGVGIEDVSEIKVSLTTGGDTRTTTTFESEGPQAGQIARQMIGSLDHEETPPQSISVRLRTNTQPGADDGADDSGDADTDAGGADRRGGVAKGEARHTGMQKRRESALGVTRNVENGRDTQGVFIEEPRVDEPQPVGEGTRKHEALQLLEKYHEEYGDDEFVSPEELYELDEMDFPHKNSLGASLSPIFLDHGLVDREKRNLDIGGATSVYRLNDAGRAELRRHREEQDDE